MLTLRKKERSQINNLTLQFKELDKEQTKPKDRRRNEIIQVRAEVNEIENQKKIQNIEETKS